MRVRLGDYVTLSVICRDGANQEQAPDNAPWVRVFQGGTYVETHTLHCPDPYGSPGGFTHRLYLDSAYSAGYCYAHVHYEVSGIPFVELSEFKIVDGGNAGGVPKSMGMWLRPEAELMLAAMEDGTLVAGANATLKES